MGIVRKLRKSWQGKVKEFLIIMGKSNINALYKSEQEERPIAG